MGKGTKGRGEEGARGEGISQMDMMKCLGGMRLQFLLTLFTRATPGTPASNLLMLQVSQGKDLFVLRLLLVQPGTHK